MTDVIVAATSRVPRLGASAAFSFDTAGTFTRASDARFVDADGVVQVASSDVLRNAHYVDSLRAVLLEPARDNLITQSQDLSAWSGAATVTANTTVAPDGTTTADTVTAASTGAVRARSFAVVGDGEKSAYLFIRQGTATNNRFEVWDSTATAIRHRVNVIWADGVPNVTTASGSGTVFDPMPLGNGWWLILISAANVVAANTNQIRLAPDYVDGTGTVIAWGGGAENAPYPTSYIPTAATTASRGAETLTVTTAQTWQAMTFYARIPYESGTGFSEGTYFALKPSAASPVISINRDTSGNYRLSHDNGSTTVHGAVGSASTLGAIVEIRGIVYADGSVQAGISINGGAESLGAQSAANAFSGTQPDRVAFGTVLNAPLLFSHFAIYNGIIPVARLRQLQNVG